MKRVSRTRLAPGGWEELKQGSEPTSGQWFGTKEKYLRMLESEAADL